ncbi:hypothetical protein Vretifemale_13523, partial [Volvox reticuliferus]
QQQQQQTVFPAQIDMATGSTGKSDGDGGFKADDDDSWAVRPWPPYLHALSVIAGNSLHIVVCETAAAAARLTEDPSLVAALGYGNGAGGGNRKLRLWPLDRLRCTDLSAAQRRAQMDLVAQ